MLRENLEKLKAKLQNFAAEKNDPYDQSSSVKGIAGTYQDPRFNRNTGGWPPGSIPDYKVRPFLYEIPNSSFKRQTTNDPQAFAENFLRSSQDLLTKFKTHSFDRQSKADRNAERLKTLLEAHQIVSKNINPPNEGWDFILSLTALGLSLEVGKEIKKYMELYEGSSPSFAGLENVIPLFIRAAGPICLTPAKTVFAAFLGPSGGGKTTAVHKLALQYRHQFHKNVRIISWTYDATDKMQSDLESIFVKTREDFLAAMNQQKNQDLVLIDTASISSLNFAEMTILQQTLAGHEEILKILVMPAYSSALDAKQFVDFYTLFPINSLLFTKMDESASLAILINSLYELGLPISYLSFGSDPLTALQAADPEQIAGEWIKRHKNTLSASLKSYV